MKKVTIGVFLGIFLIKSISAYIDPGTGGYLATTLFSSLATYIAIAIATITTFMSTYFFKPLKSFIVKNKEILKFIFIAILILALFFLAYNKFLKNPKIEFDPSLSGAHIYPQNEIYPAYYLYEGKLIDERGNLIKNWSSIYLGTIDKNGDYYAQQYYESPKWGRYTWDNQVIWELNIPIHHEIVLTPDDKVITFTKEAHEYNQRMVEFDVILVLDKNGTIIDKWSTWENLKYLQQFHKPLELDSLPSTVISEKNKKNTSIWGGNYDYYHLNSLAIVPNNSLQGEHPAFNPGNWIISFRHGSMIFILDKDTKQVLWRAIYDQVKGTLEGPHTPFMTKGGNIIVLDNGRYREYSRVISINPITLNITWEYKAENPKDFYSLSQGQIQLLPNNNLLITESEKGHVFELTPDKKIVWEFYHPEKQNEINSAVKEKYGLRQEIYRMTAYDKSFIDNIIYKNNYHGKTI